MQDTKKFYPVKGYEDYYEISKCGIVRGKDRLIHKKDGTKEFRIGRVIAPQLSNNGYHRVSFNISEKNVRNKKMLLHRLLAIQFIPNPNGYPNINHINPIQTDNRLENLEWCTQSQNIKHKFDIGYISCKRILDYDSVIDIYMNTVIGTGQGRGHGRGNVTNMCEKYNISRVVVYSIFYNKTYLNITKHLKRKGEN